VALARRPTILSDVEYLLIDISRLPSLAARLEQHCKMRRAALMLALANQCAGGPFAAYALERFKLVIPWRRQRVVNRTFANVDWKIGF